MDYADLCHALDARIDGLISPERAAHSRRVAELCAALCAREDIDPLKGRVAGLAHDMCKEMPKKTLRELAASYAAMDTEPRGPETSTSAMMAEKVMHGPAAATFLAREYGLNDRSIMVAVALHTVGQPGMDKLASALYCADKLEPGREKLDEVYRLRCLDLPLDEMLLAVVEGVVGWMKAQCKDVAPETLILYSTLVHKAGRR